MFKVRVAEMAYEQRVDVPKSRYGLVRVGRCVQLVDQANRMIREMPVDGGHVVIGVEFYQGQALLRIATPPSDPVRRVLWSYGLHAKQEQRTLSYVLGLTPEEARERGARYYLPRAAKVVIDPYDDLRPPTATRPTVYCTPLGQPLMAVRVEPGPDGLLPKAYLLGKDVYAPDLVETFLRLAGLRKMW